MDEVGRPQQHIDKNIRIAEIKYKKYIRVSKPLKKRSVKCNKKIQGVRNVSHLLLLSNMTSLLFLFCLVIVWLIDA